MTDTLNKQQLQAVTSKTPTILILAAAGSGKTKTLISRVAHLISTGTKPTKILLLTFTNKAAAEMKSRLEQMIGPSAAEVNAMTFHSFCNMRLRALTRKVGLPKYTLITPADTSDILRLLRDKTDFVISGDFPPCAKITAIISLAKNKQISIEDATKEFFEQYLNHLEEICELADAYEQYKESHHFYDFDDLLIVYMKILEENPQLRDAEERRIDYLMVDEYQDTNTLQERILQALRASNRNLCVVGDPQQSLYSFRGAEVDNILTFKDRWPDTEVIDLFVNYRSHAPILDVANSMIKAEAHFPTPKPMEADRGNGPEVSFTRPYDSFEEADGILDEIQMLKGSGVEYNEMAVLARSTPHMIFIENALIKRGIPYQKIGGLKFMDKVCVRDILALLRLTTTYTDEKSWHRILPLAPGIGNVTSTRMAEHISKTGYETLLNPKYQKDKYDGFVKDLYDHLKEWTSISFPLFFDDMTDWYFTWREKRVEIANVSASKKDELNTKLKKDKEDIKTLSLLIQPEHTTTRKFLDDIALENHKDEIKDKLTLSTIHGAKGLEWRYVWVVSLNDGMFPSTYDEDRGNKEDQEELRCMYVAITRAKDKLYLSSPICPTGFRGPSAKLSHFLEAPIEEGLIS